MASRISRNDRARIVAETVSTMVRNDLADHSYTIVTRLLDNDYRNRISRELGVSSRRLRAAALATHGQGEGA